MKRHLTYLLLTAALFGFTIKAGADDRWETLRAINWVENPTNHAKIGRFGELGPYQFRPATWRMHTKKSFQLAAQREAADEVAVIHYEWIKQALTKAGVDASPFNIAMAWNSGVDNVINGRAPAASYDYAQRVTNLVHTFKRNTPAPQPVVAALPPVSKPVIGMVHFAVMPDAPRFEIVLPPPAEEPVVYTDRTLADFSPSAPLFVVSATTATLTPRFNLLPSLLD